MKKYLLGLLAFMFVSAITLSVTSCSKSDTEDPGDNGGNGSNSSSRIVGTWYYGESENNFYEKYVFNADGTGRGYEGDGNYGYDETWSFYYKYDEKTGILNMYHNGDYDVDSYLIEFITNDAGMAYPIYDGKVYKDDGVLLIRIK